MVLGKLPVQGRPTNLDVSRARACCACRRCGWGLFGHFSPIYHFYLLFPSLWETARYRLKYCLKGPLNPNQPTNNRLYKADCNLHLPLMSWAPLYSSYLQEWDKGCEVLGIYNWLKNPCLRHQSIITYSRNSSSTYIHYPQKGGRKVLIIRFLRKVNCY